MNRTTTILAIAIVALLLATGLLECQHIKREANNAMQILALNNTLTITKNRLGQETAHTGALVAEYSAFKGFQFAKSDSLGRALKKAVNARTLTATIATQQMTIRAELPTTQTLAGQRYHTLIQQAA